MSQFKVPTREEVSNDNQAIFDKLQKAVGFVPNVYAYIAKNETALGDYLGFQNRKSTLSAKEKEVINLVVSQINGCDYCLSAHTAIGGMNGFDEGQILEIRQGAATFDSKLDALAKFAHSTATNKGNATQEAKDAFFAAGYTEANLIDTVFGISEITVTNYVNNLTRVPIDFPVAPSLETVHA